MKFNVIIVVLALVTIGVSGCSTVSGVGRDIESLGKTVQGQ